MPTSTDDRRDLRTVIASMKAAPGKQAELQAEHGFANDDPLDAHLATPRLVRFAGLIGDLLDENGLMITRLRRIA